MVKSMREFFKARIQSVMQADDEAISDRTLQLATAALLIEMTHADFHVTSDEKNAVKRALQKAFDLSTHETNELVTLAEQEVKEASSLYQFTDLIDKNFSLEKKKKVVAMLWRVAFADDHKDMHEEYLVRKIADLIHVSHKDFIYARHVVEEEIDSRSG